MTESRVPFIRLFHSNTRVGLKVKQRGPNEFFQVFWSMGWKIFIQDLHESWNSKTFLPYNFFFNNLFFKSQLKILKKWKNIETMVENTMKRSIFSCTIMKCQLATSFATCNVNVHVNIFSFFKNVELGLISGKNILIFWEKNYRGKNVLEFHDSWRSSRNFFNPLTKKLGKNRGVPFVSVQSRTRDSTLDQDEAEREQTVHTARGRKVTRQFFCK
jgi:hypothetical protein